MKTLHLNYSDNKGGAAIACGRLIESLNKNNTTSELLTNEKYLKKNTGTANSNKIYLFLIIN